MIYVTLAQLKEVIQKEVQWCVGHESEGANTADYKKGFIGGLQQALFFINKYEQLKEEA